MRPHASERLVLSPALLVGVEAGKDLRTGEFKKHIRSLEV